MKTAVAFNLKATQSARRVWALFLLAPFILFVSFVPFVAHISLGKDLGREQIFSLTEGIAWLPSATGFAIILFLTRYMARRDGLTLKDLGWTTPDWKNIVTGALIGTASSAICIKYVYPALSASVHTFNPTLSNIPVLPAILMFSTATISENTLYRSYALGVLGNKYGFPLSAIISSLFYSLLVPAQAWQLHAFAFALGLFLCIVRLFAKSMWMTVACHFTLSISAKLTATTQMTT